MINIDFNSIDWSYDDQFSVAKYAGELIGIARIAGEIHPIVNQHIMWFLGKPKMQHTAFINAIGNTAQLPTFNGDINEALPERWDNGEIFVISLRASQVVMTAKSQQ